MSDDFIEKARSELIDEFRKIVRAENESLLREHTCATPLLRIGDVARTLNLSVRSIERLVADKQIPVLWISGSRRVHPDVLKAFLKVCAKVKRKTSTTKKR